MENPEEIAEFDRREKRGTRKLFIAACFPPDLAGRIRAAAKAEDRPVSSLVRRAVDRYLASEHGEAA
jgi:hypothetical protein